MNPTSCLTTNPLRSTEVTSSGLARPRERDAVSTRRARVETRTVLAAITVVAAALTVCACGTGSDESSGAASSSPRAQQWTPGMDSPTTRRSVTTVPTLPPQESGVERTDPDRVAIAAVTIWFAWDTATDNGPNAAAARTAPLLSSTYAEQVTGTAPIGSPGADWLGWASRKARMVVTAHRGAEPTPPPTATTAFTQLVVSQAVTLPDGTVTATLQKIVDIKLTRGPSGWEVASVRPR